jgi:hypothetical protein
MHPQRRGLANRAIRLYHADHPRIVADTARKITTPCADFHCYPQKRFIWDEYIWDASIWDKYIWRVAPLAAF